MKQNAGTQDRDEAMGDREDGAREAGSEPEAVAAEREDGADPLAEGDAPAADRDDPADGVLDGGEEPAIAPDEAADGVIPFLLLSGEDDTPSSPPPGDLLTRLLRLLGEVTREETLAGAVRRVVPAWLGDTGWRVGFGVTREDDGSVVVSALGVADPGNADRWKNGVAELRPEELQVLVEGSAGAASASELPERLALRAREAGLDRIDRFPIDASGRVAGSVIVLHDAERPPAVSMRRAMQVSHASLEQVASRLRAHAAVTGAARHIRDLTARARRADDLDAEPGGDALLLRGAECGLWHWDLETDRVHLSPRWKALLGCGTDEIGEEPSEWFDRIHPDDADRVELELLEHLERQSPRFESEHRLLHSDGSYRWVRVRAVAERDEDGKAVRIAGSMLDISGDRLREHRDARDFMYNRLTGFPTSPLLTDRIEQAMRRRVRRPDRAFAVVAVSFTGIREQAERLDGEALEELLLTAGRRIATAVRPGDTVAHLDELQFGLVLDDVKSLDDATRIAGRIGQALSQGIPIGRERLALAPAMGLALSRTAYEAPEDMLRDAGIALRRALRENTAIQVFDASTRAFAQSMADLEGALRHAFDARELHLEYQPVVALSDGRITGVEAFLRWNHPERGPIAPSELIPVAEESGVLPEIGYWTVERACRQMKQWIDRYHLPFPPNIAINVTESQLFGDDFVARTMEAVEASGLDPRLLRLDVSESSFMKDGAEAGRILRALTKRGVRIAVDDFGTGYSSLSYLHRYPVGALKIDRAFVSGAGGASKEWDVARTIIALARILELEVIAEGIETREQFVKLKSLGCQQAQGYFFSGPVPAAKAARLIEGGYPLDAVVTDD